MSQTRQQVKGLCSDWRRADWDAWNTPPFPTLGWIWDPSLLYANLGAGANIPHRWTSGSSSVTWGFIHSSSRALNTWYAPGTVVGLEALWYAKQTCSLPSQGFLRGEGGRCRWRCENGTHDRSSEGRFCCPGGGVVWQGLVWGVGQSRPWRPRNRVLWYLPSSPSRNRVAKWDGLVTLRLHTRVKTASQLKIVSSDSCPSSSTV